VDYRDKPTNKQSKPLKHRSKSMPQVDFSHSDELSDRQEEIVSAAAHSLGSDSDDLPQHPYGAAGELDDDYAPQTDAQIEEQLTSYDRTDVADDN
jgi:hypothetical protein